MTTDTKKFFDVMVRFAEALERYNVLFSEQNKLLSEQNKLFSEQKDLLRDLIEAKCPNLKEERLQKEKRERFKETGKILEQYSRIDYLQPNRETEPEELDEVDKKIKKMQADLMKRILRP